MEQSNSFSSGKGRNDNLWYVDNYVLLKDYYDRTISRVAARCVRKGNIAMEEYEQYGYILDLLDEICETGDYILAHQDLFAYVEKRMAGGINALKKNLEEFKTELKNNASPEMIKQDKDELKKFKDALGAQDKSADPTAGAGMSMDQVIEKLMQGQGGQPTPQTQPQQAAPQQPQAASQAQQGQPQQHPVSPQGQPAPQRPVSQPTPQAPQG